MKKYQVGVKIYNSFEVEANSEEEAEEKVRELDVYATLRECDLNICYVDEIKERDIPREMCDDLIKIVREKEKSEMTDSQALYESTGGRIYCDDEHGNAL